MVHKEAEIPKLHSFIVNVLKPYAKNMREMRKSLDLLQHAQRIYGWLEFGQDKWAIKGCEKMENCEDKLVTFSSIIRMFAQYFINNVTSV